MAAMKMYFILFLLFVSVSARPSNEEDFQFSGVTGDVVTSTSKPAKDGSYLYLYHKNVYNKDWSPASIVTIHKKCLVEGTCVVIQYSELVFKDEDGKP